MHANLRLGNHDFVTAFCRGLAPCADGVPAAVRSAASRGAPAALWAIAASDEAAQINLDAKDLDTVVSRWFLAIHRAAQ
jgi:hypothetical protein